MRRRNGRATRPVDVPTRSTPIPSTLTTPAGSAAPSTCTTESEWDPDDDVSSLRISALTLDVPVRPLVRPKRTRTKPFPFLALPSELRLKIYGYYFAQTRTVDLDPTNQKGIHKKLGLLRTCHQVHDEASHYFYSSHTFRMFPTHPGRFFKTKKPLLARLTSGQRRCLTSLELRLGPGWNKPPRGWVVNPALGLADCVAVRRLTVFVECDPSDGIFNGFRRADGFYEGFCRELLDGVLAAMPWVDTVHFDAWTSVKKGGDMMQGLLAVAACRGRQVCWGPERGWTDGADDVELLQAAMNVPSVALMGGLGGMGMPGLVAVA